MDFLKGAPALPYPTKSFKGQTIIVTGSNVGLGLEAARHFVRLEASKVILACRSVSKAEDAARSIAETTGRQGVCEVWQVDLADFDSIKAFTDRAATLDRLDVVHENAGIASFTYTEIEGIESMTAVNVVGTFLMALNLLPVLRRSGKRTGVVPRLVITSSDVHSWSKMAERHEASIFDALNKNKPEYIADRYNTSKLLEVLFVRSLAEQMTKSSHSADHVILSCLNPGLCHSDLGRSLSGISALSMWFMKFMLARSTEVGSRTLLHAASAGEESHGQYFSDCKISDPSAFTLSEEGKVTQDRVFKELMAILEKIQPGITNCI